MIDSKLVFLDTEFTGLHASTTLVSVGMVTLDGEEFQMSLNDYNKDQVTEWLEENVLSYIDHESAVSSRAGFQVLNEWLLKVGQGARISLVSAGLSADTLLLFDLFRYMYKENTYFNAVNQLPDFLKHPYHFDLNTLFVAAGIDPEINREDLIDIKILGNRHEALYDAKVVRQCFLKIKDHPSLSGFARFS